MADDIAWVEPEMVRLQGRLTPGFADDARFTASWWSENANLRPPSYLWRSYSAGGEEVARVLLSLGFPSHSGDASVPALLVWSFEVRDDLRGDGFGTTIVDQLAREFPDRELYIGATAESASFWERFGWPMCDCDECDGRDFIVRRP